MSDYYDRLNELDDERDKILDRDFFATLKFRQEARPANYAHIINPGSEYTALLLQTVVNLGPDYIEFLHDEPRKIAGKMSPREFTDDETWMVKALHNCSGFVVFEDIILGDESLEKRAMIWGMHPKWIMISATDAGSAVQTIFGSKNDSYPNLCRVGDEYKHEFEIAMAERRFPSSYKTEIVPVDFTSLPAAAKTIRTNYHNPHKIKLLAWHLGRVPDKYSANFRDTEKFLDEIEASLIQTRADLKKQQKKDAKEKEESEKRLQVDRRAELEAGRTCVANIETDRELIDWANAKGLTVYIERKRKKYPEAINGSKWCVYGKVNRWDEEYLGWYKNHLYELRKTTPDPLINHINELKGKLLVGEHYPKPSHGDILAELANVS